MTTALYPSVGTFPTALSEAQIIDGAKTALLTDGWMQHDFRCSETGERCAVGALRWAAFGNEEPSGAELLEGNYIEALKAVANTISVTALRDIETQDVENFRGGDGNCGDPDCCPYNADERQPEVNRVYAIEEIVTGYNDARVQTRAGRNAVIRRFDRAVATLA